jgi:signal transduction histidine kinase
VADASMGSGLYALLKDQRQALIDRWGQRISGTTDSAALSRAELLDRIPFFVDEVIAALYPEAVPLPASADNASEHGAQRFRLGFDVGEVIREYGMLQECILDLAGEAGLTIGLSEHAVINKWLNRGIAHAISQYMSHRELEMQRQASEHLGFMAHEVRNPLAAVQMAFTNLRHRELAGGGRAVEILERNLRRTTEVVDSALTHASLRMGVLPRPESIRMRPFLEDLAMEASLAADGKNISVDVAVSPDLVIDADLRLLRSAVSNLLNNAIKFSKPKATVIVRAELREGRVAIDVVDGCGGLPPGKAEELFAPLVQRADDRTGFGLGLAIAMQSATAHNGTVKVRDVPGNGCVFTIDLPAIGGNGDNAG